MYFTQIYSQDRDLRFFCLFVLFWLIFNLFSKGNFEIILFYLE